MKGQHACYTAAHTSLLLMIYLVVTVQKVTVDGGTVNVLTSILTINHHMQSSNLRVQITLSSNEDDCINKADWYDYEHTTYNLILYLCVLAVAYTIHCTFKVIYDTKAA